MSSCLRALVVKKLKIMKTKTILTSVLLMCVLLITAQTKDELRPPADLQAQHILDNPNVYLTWWAPGTPYWLHYDQGVYANGIGFNGPAVFDVAIKYEPVQMTPFDGMELTQFAFVPAEAAAVYIIKFWVNENADSVIYVDTLSGLTIKEWNIIDLDSALIIDGNNTYYFGYNCIAEAGHPAGCDNGPVVAPGKSDLFRTDGDFFSLYEEADISLNFNIQVYVQPATEKGIKPIAINDINNNNAELSSIKRLMFQKQKHFTKPKPKGAMPDSYKIYRDDVEISLSTEPEYMDVLPDGGIYTYEVSAVYSGDESVKSNSVEVLFDNSRVPYNTVITETFINVGETNGIMHSPASPGPFMGIKELAFEVDNIAPIIYHSGTQILGSDPFSNADNEDRFMYYILATGGFPMTLFNARLYKSGGHSTESLYEVYRPLYDSALNMLTPIAFECSLERVLGTKYILNATAKKVGIYTNPNTVLHVVLTRQTIDYDWNGGEFDEVKFVASGMFPDFEGTAFNFVGDTVATASVEVTVDMFEPADNYRVIAFVQSTTGYTILNGDILSLPKKKAVKFTVVDAEATPIEGAAISTNDETKITDAAGVASFAIYDNLGELEYSVLHDGFSEITGYFNMDTTENVLVTLLPTDIDNTIHIKSHVYPNPVKSTVNVVTDINTDVKIFNSLGVMVYNYKQQQYSQTIDMSAYNNGIYFINLSSNNKNNVFRLVKTE